MLTVILRLRKVEFIKFINLIEVFLIGFVKFEIKQLFSAYQDQFCVWFSLARLRTAREFFSESFSKKETYLFRFPFLPHPPPLSDGNLYPVALLRMRGT